LITQFFLTHSTWLVQAAGVLISAVLLWEVLFRGQLGVSLAFFEEVYSRNLGHLFVSPLRPYELVCALLSISLLRTLVGVGTALLLALPLYHFSLFDLGLPLIAFFANLLVMGWAIGLLVAALVMRYGLGAESMAWVAIFALQPISGVYCPIEVLPGWAQLLAYGLPSSHVFEGMRALLLEESFRGDLMVKAVGANVVWIVTGAAVFLGSFRYARSRGLLLQQGGIKKDLSQIEIGPKGGGGNSYSPSSSK